MKLVMRIKGWAMDKARVTFGDEWFLRNRRDLAAALQPARMVEEAL